jgi:hypothetical protein
VLLIAGAPAAAQENIKILGVTMSAMMGGGFKPAGTEFLCTAIDNGRCYDGKKWHDLFPPGPRKYATDAPDKVTCAAFVGGDCWTVDRKWYRMPRGQLMGVTMSPMSATPGAFMTAPLR